MEADAHRSTVDFWMSPAPGVEVLAPSRVVPRGSGSEFIFTQFQGPGMSDQAFASRGRDARWRPSRSYCGLGEAAPCHCSRRVARAEALGRLHREAPVLASHPAVELADAVQEVEGLHDAARLMRQHHRTSPRLGSWSVCAT
jgi:hypothetical protein